MKTAKAQNWAVEPQGKKAYAYNLCSFARAKDHNYCIRLLITVIKQTDSLTWQFV
jgi:hypothetical protein